MPALYVWYFSQYNETLAQAHWSLVIQVYTNGQRKLRYLDDNGNAVTVDNVPHGSADWQIGTYRTQAEAGQDVTDGGMSSFR